ncbi:MAG: glycosyltransferase [Desulfuromonadales bacterium]|nr:glycosyltransferase [Desulfuromonadales bacterium]
MTNDQRKISVFLPSLIGGGAERVMLNLACGFVRRGVPVDLLLATAEGPYLKEVPDEIRIIDLTAGRVRASVLPLVRYLRSEKPAVLLSALDHTNCAAVIARNLAKAATQVAITLHNTPSEKTKQSPTYRKFLGQRVVRYTHARADIIIAVSAGVAADYAELYKTPATKIEVIFNPVISPRMLAQSRQFLDHPWFAAGQPPVLVGVGRLTEQKDFATLIEAFARVRAAGVSCRLLILGEGELRSSLEALVRQHGLQKDVALPGFVDNPYQYLANARLFVLSSRWEGLPTVLIEALAAGTPVVSTNCKSGPDEILECGRFGRLVPVQNVSALAKAIIDELGKAKSLPPQNSWEQFQSSHSVDNYLKRLLTAPAPPTCG